MVVAEEDFEGNQLQAVRDKGFKLLTANEGNPRGLDTRMFFDVASDPGETTSLVGQDVGVCGTYLSDWQKNLEADLRDAVLRAKAGAVVGGTAELSDAECHNLVALGYLEPGSCE